MNANTGANKSSYNTNGSSDIITGNANVVATVITDANAVAMGIYQFDVNGNQNGDIVLTQDPTKCVNCDASGNVIKGANTGNGADSTNTANTTSTANNVETINNNGDIVNNINLTANSGNNKADYNTGGDSSITTGDANVVTNVINTLNTIVDGAINTVNIFGNLVGNIVLPQAASAATVSTSCTTGGSGGVVAANTGNGTGTTNTTNASSTTNNTTNQTNNANVTNNLNLNGTTGNNDTNFNTGGQNAIDTGQVTIASTTNNVANMNVINGNCGQPVNLVFINDPNGNWQGQILGLAPGTFVYAPDGNIYCVGANGELLAVNSGNGAGSTNTANASSTTNNTTNQNNTGSITNNINIDANTGGNTADYNTNGSSKIKTGNANIYTNVVNLINSSFAGCKVVLTMVNVMGSWLGNLVSSGFVAASSGSNSGGGSSSSGNNNGGGSNNNSAEVGSATTTIANPQAGIAGGITSGFRSLVAGLSTEKKISNDDSIQTVKSYRTNAGGFGSDMSFILKMVLLMAPLALGTFLLRRKLASIALKSK
jgi:hypothetical protein